MRLSVILLSFSLSALATDVLWNDSVNGSSWNLANHWSPVGIPGNSDTAIFNTIGSNVFDQFKISIIAPVSVGSLQFNNENTQTSYWIFGPTSLQLNATTGNSSITVNANNKQQTLLDTPIILGKDLYVSNFSPYRLIFENAIMGSCHINMTGLVEYSGTIPNTYSGTTTLKHGTIRLNKASGVNAIAGNLLLDSAIVDYFNDRQVSPTSTITLLSNSTINLGSHQETYLRLQLEKSSSPNKVLIGAGGALSILERLTLADQSIIDGAGSLILTGENAEISFVGTSQNATIYTQLDLGNRMRKIAVHSAPHLTLSGQVANGGITKTGYGILDITSSANLSGLSIEEGGVHLKGHLICASPIQIDPEAFLYGTGSIEGNLVIRGTVTVGEVESDNTPSNVTEYFSFDKLYNGAQSELLFLTGEASPGYVSNGIHVDGDIFFTPASTLIVNFSPDMLSRLDTNGKIILESPNVLLTPTEGIYRLNQSYRILYAGSLEGQVGTISTRYPLLNPLISYITEDGYSGLSFSLGLNSFSSLFRDGEQAQVAAFLDALSAAPSSNSPIILEALINTSSIDELSDSLSQLHPSALTSLSVSLENDLFYVRNAIFSRLYQDQQNCFCPSENSCGFQIWGGAFGGFAHQTNQEGEPGYHAQSPGAILGVDAQIRENILLGCGISYIYTFHEWKRHRGDAKIQTINGSLYTQVATPYGYFAANATGGYSFYDVDRRIHLGPGGVLHGDANSDFGGAEGSIDLRMGAHFGVRSATITPFLGFDYMIIHQNGFQEDGARVLNLKLKNHTADLLTSEGGFECNFCHWKDQVLLKALLRFSAIAESRFFGRYERATFSNGGHVKVKGLYPSRILGAFGAGFSATIGASTVSLSYQAKTNWDFTDQFLALEYLWEY